MTLTEIQLVDAAGETLAEDRIAPAGVTGADKVAQRVVYALLTPLGSVPGRPADGTPFLALVKNFASEFDVSAAFSASLPALAQTVKAAELAAEPASEKYGGSRIVRLTLASDQATLTLAVAAADGSTPAAPVSFTLDA